MGLRCRPRSRSSRCGKRKGQNSNKGTGLVCLLHSGQARPMFLCHWTVASSRGKNALVSVCPALPATDPQGPLCPHTTACTEGRASCARTRLEAQVLWQSGQERGQRAGAAVVCQPSCPARSGSPTPAERHALLRALTPATARRNPMIASSGPRCNVNLFPLSGGACVLARGL